MWEIKERIRELVNVVKNTLDGHGSHVCPPKVVREAVSFSNLVTLKANAKKAKKKIEKRACNEIHVGNETEIEMEGIHLQEHTPGVSNWAGGNECPCRFTITNTLHQREISLILVFHLFSICNPVNMLGRGWE